LKLTVLKAKIHHIKVTGKNLFYEGSLTLDKDLMKKANLFPFEKVEIFNITNGERFSSYLLPGEEGECILNGAAARKGEIGDLLIVVSYLLIDEEELRKIRPKIIILDEENRIKEEREEYPLLQGE